MARVDERGERGEPVKAAGPPWMLLCDLAVSAALVVMALQETGRSPLWRASEVALALSVTLRRRFPIAVMAFVGAMQVRTLGTETVVELISFIVAAQALVAYGRSGRLRWIVLGVAVVAFIEPWDGDWYAVDPVGRIFVCTAVVVGSVALGLYERSQHTLRASLADRAELLAREQTAQGARVRAEERNRLAAELHDALGHEISLIAVEAGALAVADGDPAARSSAAERIRANARQALEELRQIVAVLDGGDAADRSPFTLAGLTTLAERIRQTGARVRLTVSEPGGLRDDVERLTFRIVQEALTNALKYAPGADLSVTVAEAAGCLSVAVVNGPGDVSAAAPAGGGRGLHGLSERVRRLDGGFQAGPTPDGGFRVVARIPIA